MLKFIETEIDGIECSFHVRIIVSNASFDRSYYEIDVAFEIEDCNGCTEAQAEAYCKERESRLIDLALQDIADKEEDRRIAGSVY